MTWCHPRIVFWLRSIAVLALGGLTACGGVLPERHEITTSPFSSFDEAYQVYTRVNVDQTTAQDLLALGYNALETPNIRLLTYLEVAETFLPTDSVPLSYLPDGVVRCLEAKTRCAGYAVAPREIHEERVGNLFLDFLDFRRETQTTGWEVQALFVLVDDVVVYKLWSGTPRVDETAVSIKPLGPIQDVGTILNRAIPDFD